MTKQYVIDTLHEAFGRAPDDCRFGQLLVLALHHRGPISEHQLFMLSDEDLVEALDAFIEKRK